MNRLQVANHKGMSRQIEVEPPAHNSLKLTRIIVSKNEKALSQIVVRNLDGSGLDIILPTAVGRVTVLV